MAYQLPGRYRNDEPSDDEGSEGEFSVDISIDQEYDSEGEDESERVEEKRRRPPPRRPSHESTRSGGGGGGGGGRRVVPGRSKSYQDDGRRHGSSSRSGSGGMSGSSRSGGRHTPRRSKTFEGERQNARMPRRETSTLDPETIASNRARRLRAMGGGDKNKEPVRLVRRSQSFKQDQSGAKLGESFSHRDEDDEEKKDDRRERKPPRRTFSNDLPPEEQQYARTAARGVTRSKSLKAERPDLDRASKDVAARLGKLTGATKDATKGVSALKF